MENEKMRVEEMCKLINETSKQKNWSQVRRGNDPTIPVAVTEDFSKFYYSFPVHPQHRCHNVVGVFCTDEEEEGGRRGRFYQPPHALFGSLMSVLVLFKRVQLFESKRI